MKRDNNFLNQLGNFRNETEVIASYIYADMGIQHAASKSKKLLDRLNCTPSFWISTGNAYRTAAYSAIHRVFDQTNSRYNIYALVDSIENNLGLFQKEALANRKREGKTEDPPWLNKYLAESYYPDSNDVRELRKKITRYEKIYKNVIQKPRHSYIAHRSTYGRENVQKLFSGGKVSDLWKLSTFLIRFHDAIDQLYLNGRKPVLRPIRYSVKRIYDSDYQSSIAHELIVEQVKELMIFLETASPELDRKQKKWRIK